jgi:hypothetical protein
VTPQYTIDHEREISDYDHWITNVNYSEGFGHLAEVERAKNRVSEEAEVKRRALITALTQGLDRGHKQKLEACSSNSAEPCNCSICPVCVERTQRSLIAEVAACVDHLFSEGELPIVAVSADFPRQRYEHIIDINLRSLNHKIQRQYTEARFPLAVSAVLVSLSRDDRTEAGFGKLAFAA